MLNLVEETDAMEDWRAALGDDYAVTMSATLKETTFLTKILTVIDEVWRDVQLTPSSLADALHHGHDGTISRHASIVGSLERSAIGLKIAATKGGAPLMPPPMPMVPTSGASGGLFLARTSTTVVHELTRHASQPMPMVPTSGASGGLFLAHTPRSVVHELTRHASQSGGSGEAATETSVEKIARGAATRIFAKLKVASESESGDGVVSMSLTIEELNCDAARDACESECKTLGVDPEMWEMYADDLFEMIDMDGDGVVTLDELTNGIIRLGAIHEPLTPGLARNKL
jgi:hypothetical protein